MPSTDGGFFELTLNGESVTVGGVRPTTTLLEYLRARGLTGSKEGCAEGDCGACTVVINDRDGHGGRTWRAVHACITFLPMLAGRDVVTVEGVGTRDSPHAIQKAMVEAYGSQCGFCTPGFVASMFEGYYREDVPPDRARELLADQLSGNLCRCTGYRPIRDAMLAARAAREELARLGSPPDLFQLQLSQSLLDLPAVDIRAAAERFLRPTSLTELLRLRAEHPDAVVVGGATELGVERNKKRRDLPLLLSTEGVASLREVRRDTRGFIVGGAATLTQIAEATNGTLPSLDQMLAVFAARQVRNRATLAGNLVTASPIGDLAPVLLSVDAEVVLASVRGERAVPIADFFVAYRTTLLAADEILREVVIPYGPAHGLKRRVRAMKVSKRRELDISIVSAAFTVDLDSAGTIRKARLAYGGVAATPIRAREAEAHLEGRAWDDSTLHATCEILRRSFKPISDARAGFEYRRELTSALFEKFWHGVRSDVTDAALSFLPGAPTEDTMPAVSLRHESAWGHVTGSAAYIDDEASRRYRVLDMWPVLATHPHARLDHVDTRAARAMPGVVDVLTAREIPGQNEIGAIRHDEPLLVDEHVSFHGQMVAMIVGESLAACRDAARAVSVVATPLPALLGIDAAIEAGSYHTEPHVIRKGDVDAAMQASPHTLSGEIEIGGQEHFYLEAQAAWAERGDDGDVFVCSSTQHPSEIQEVVSRVLSLPRNRVVVQSSRMGGGFGGKETQGNAFAALAALAAWRTGRAARVQLDRDVDMQVTGKRHPFLAKFQAGFDGTGRLLALRVTLVSDGGYALDLSQSIMDRALFHLDNAYDLPAVHFEGRVAKTNTASNTAFRGFGGPQGMLVIEDVLARVAAAVGVAPDVVRARNLYRVIEGGERPTTPYGQSLDDDRLARMWTELNNTAQVDRRRAAIRAWNVEHLHTKRGLAVTPVKFGISFTAAFLNQAGALVVLYRDGTAQVNHGGTEMGQGLATKILGIAMRALGLPEHRIRVLKTRTDKVPNTSATAASSGADLNGAAVLAACETLRDRLAPVAASMLNEITGGAHHARTLRFEDGSVHAASEPDLRLRFEDVVERAYALQVSLAAVGYYRTPGLAYDRAAGRGRPFHYFACGVAASEVEVDGLTGMKRALRVDILHDVGDSLNPAIDRGQIEGGFVQGMGWLTAEELRWDATGRLLTHSASTYMIPSIGDAPAELHVALLEQATQASVVYGSKAVGEPPLMLALSVREAIREAIGAFGDGSLPVELPSPATHEAIFLAIKKVRGRGLVG